MNFKLTDEEWIARNPYVIRMRRHIEVNTDPQRRCHAKSEIVQTPWESIDRARTLEDAHSRLNFWRSLNEYAVSQRGESAKIDYDLQVELT